MTNEIKEIREYISCPQFGDDHYGKWGALRLDQRKKIKDLLDYMNNLQEENEKLKKQYAKEEKKLFHDNEILQQRIDKAIKYCEESSKTIKSEYFSDVLKILKEEGKY